MDIDLLIESKGLFQIVFPKGEFVLADGTPLSFSESRTFHFRLLTMREYEIFNKLLINGVLVSWDLYWKVFVRVYAGNADHLGLMVPAGLGITIGKLAMHLSGDNLASIDDMKKSLHVARTIYQGNSVQENLKFTIASAFPSYTWEQFDSWSYEELIRKWAIAEMVLQKRLGETYTPLSIKDIGKKQGKGGPVDFAADNAAIRKTQNPMDLEKAMNKQRLQTKIEPEKKALSGADLRKLQNKVK